MEGEEGPNSQREQHSLCPHPPLLDLGDEHIRSSTPQ